MREILFRGKRQDSGEWVYGTPILYSNGTIVICKEYQRNHNVDPETVGQYTGLTDKNGTKIFEGDILDFVNEYRELGTRWKCVVEYAHGAFICRYIDCDGHLGTYNHFESWNAPLVKWWVIGNVYDNPELIE